ncbi:MAG: HAD-IIIC family phosphatase [Nitrospinales bacterium]
MTPSEPKGPCAGKQLKETRVAFIGNITLQPVQSHLRTLCLELGLKLEIFFGGYDLYVQEIVDPQSGLYKFNPHFTFLILDNQTLLPELYKDFFSIEPGRRLEMVENKMGQLLALADQFLEHSNSGLALGNFPFPRNYLMGIYDSKTPAGEREILQKMNQTLIDHVRSVSGRLHVLDIEKLLANCGKTAAADEKMRYLAKMMIPAKVMPSLARELMRYIRPVMGMTRKCLVLDLDNTLWGGVLGEDGIEGIKLGLEPPGNAFYEFQKTVKSLQHRGVLLAINSKNDLELVREVFQKHPDMQLKLDDFACVRANWQDKAQNMREIAAELNIGLDSLVFMDDHPAERLLIQQALPEILTVDMPEDCAEFAQTLLALDAFEVLHLTEEDRKRKRLYRAEAKRKELKRQVTDLTQYLQSLRIAVQVCPADPFSIPRIAQLTQRTNQFNLTTRRYNEADIKKFAASQAHRVYFLKSSDRFGEHGIVGACITQKNGSAVEIDTLLLSCRVIGRGIEQAFLHFVCNEARTQAADKLVGHYLPTRKNRLAENFYADEKFDVILRSEQETIFELDLRRKTVPLPAHIRLNANYGR